MEKDYDEYVTFNVTTKDGLYIYRSNMEKDGFRVEKISREFEYKRVAEAYMEME